MRWGLAFACGALIACGDNLDDGAGDERLQGGARTVDDRSRTAFEHPLPGLDAAQEEQHRLGRGPVAFHWIAPQLGPLFNNDACLACHAGNGRGLSQAGPSAFGSQALIRVSLEAGAPTVPGGPIEVPGFGTQLQDHAIAGLPEVAISVAWIERFAQYGDGEVVTLRAPRVIATRPDGTALPPMDMSYRQAPPLFGLGLLEAVPDATLRALADPDDADGDGISGRVNLVWDLDAGATRIGRFGHKASVPTLAQQTAAAFADDMGLSNRMFPDPDGMTDVSTLQLGQAAFFIATLAVPTAAPRDATAARGRALFDDYGCAGCHTPTLVTGADHPIPQLRDQTIHPYTDLLLHDVGDELTDARDDFVATGQEWRTPPLWGLGLTMTVAPDATYLHDGRARTVAEAILWHDGEALAAREAFRRAARGDREALLAFLATL